MMREMISAMVDNILVEIYHSSGVEKVGKEERKEWNGWTKETNKGMQIDILLWMDFPYCA